MAEMNRRYGDRPKTSPFVFGVLIGILIGLLMGLTIHLIDPNHCESTVAEVSNDKS